jgi:hypothetical protein
MALECDRSLEERASFCEQKEAKKLYSFWARAVSAARAQFQESFCAAFFKKRPLSY